MHREPFWYAPRARPQAMPSLRGAVPSPLLSQLPMAQDGLTLGLLHHDRFLQAPHRPDPPPAPDQNNVSE